MSTIPEFNKMTSRWSNARQRVIDTARVLIISKECTYAISGLGEADRAAEVKKLLDDEAFHFGKANSVGDFSDGEPIIDHRFIFYLVLNQLLGFHE